VADKALQSGDLDLEPDGGVQAAFQAQINADPDLKKYADNPTTGFVRFLAVTPTVPPLDNEHCRKAIFYAINKADLVKARGGSYGGVVAPTMATPSTVGYDANANPYPSGPDDTGDLAKAKDELKQCGKPDGFEVNMAYVSAGKAVAVFEAAQQALARVGITVNSAAIGDQSSYYKTYVGSPANVVDKKLGLMQSAWGSDFPSGYGFWNSIANGKAIVPVGNGNVVNLDDPVVNQLLDSSVTAKPEEQADIYTKVDAQVMKDAVCLPYAYDKTLYYHSPRLTNLYLMAGAGYFYDYVQIGVSDGK
jgi:peptide/nickel transport system substrate-binding protein